MPEPLGGVPSANHLGTASNPVTDAAAPRPTGLAVVWWKTATIPANALAGDIRISPGG